MLVLISILSQTAVSIKKKKKKTFICKTSETSYHLMGQRSSKHIMQTALRGSDSSDCTQELEQAYKEYDKSAVEPKAHAGILCICMHACSQLTVHGPSLVPEPFFDCPILSRSKHACLLIYALTQQSAGIQQKCATQVAHSRSWLLLQVH